MVAQIERSVVLDAPVERVWELLVGEGELATWFGGDVDLEPRPGGVVRVDDADGRRRGTVEVFEPQRELAFRVWTSPLDGPLEGSRVGFRLEPLDDEHTVLTVTETQLTARASALVHG